MNRDDQIKKCLKVIEYMQTTWNPFGFFSSAGDLSKFPKDIQDEARNTWTRRKYSGIYEATNSLCNNYVQLAKDAFPNNSISTIMPIIACGLAFMTVKCDDQYDNKTKIAIGDLCRDILKRYFSDIDEKWDLVLDFIDSLRTRNPNPDMEGLMINAIKSIGTKTNVNTPSSDELRAFIKKMLSEFQKTSFR